jgi:hypothetical protein
MSTTYDADDLDAPVWGARAISEIINRSEAHTRKLLQARKLPTKKVGIWHVSTKRKLREALGVL